MPAVIAEPGAPYWISLYTADPTASANFYQRVLGWDIEKERTVRVQGLPIAELLPIDEGAPLWTPSFYVGDLSTVAERAEALGGKALTEITATPMGDIILVTDPAGVMVGLLNPPVGQAFTALGEPGCVCWYDYLGQGDSTPAAREFYGAMLGWGESIQGDTVFATLDGMPVASYVANFGRGAWLPTFGVLNVAAAVETAQAEGGALMSRGPENAVLLDPQGLAFGLLEVLPYQEETVQEGDDIFGGRQS